MKDYKRKLRNLRVSHTKECVSDEEKKKKLPRNKELNN